MPAGQDRRRGIAAVAVLAAYLAGLLPERGPGRNRRSAGAARAAALQYAKLRAALRRAIPADRRAGLDAAHRPTPARPPRRGRPTFRPARATEPSRSIRRRSRSRANRRRSRRRRSRRARPIRPVDGADLSGSRRRDAAADPAGRTGDAAADRRHPPARRRLRRATLRSSPISGTATASAASRATRSATCTSTTATKRSSARSAHFDGVRTITITGHPFIVNHEHNSVLTADEIVFDTVEQTAKLVNGKGASDEGRAARPRSLQRQRPPHRLRTAPSTATTRTLRLARIRAAAITSPARTWTSIPATRSSFIRPCSGWARPPSSICRLLIIPLRSVEGQRGHANWFPEVGYDSYEGAWIKVQIPFGKDQYYYGYYIVNYFTKDGPGSRLRRLLFEQKRPAQRQRQLLHDQQPAGGRHADEPRAARARELLAAPARQLSVHVSVELRSAGTAFRPTRRSARPSLIKRSKRRKTTASATTPSAVNPAATASPLRIPASSTKTSIRRRRLPTATATRASAAQTEFSNQSEFDYLLQYTTSGADYQMEFDKTYSLEATGINKIPEFEVRPSDFFQHFFIPLSADLTVGEYSNPAGDGQPLALATWRGDANLDGGTRFKQRCSEAISKAPSRSTNTPTAPATSRPRSSKI